MAKKSPRTRDTVFKGHVFDRLFPSEKKDVSTGLKELTSISLSKSSASSQSAPAKVYTVQLPPEGLPEAQTVTNYEISHGNIPSDSSASESADDVDEDKPLPRKRKRKRRRGQKVLDKCHALEILPTSSASCTVNQEDPDSSKRTLSGSCGDAQRTDVSSLTKNQRKKLRKRRGKLGKMQKRSTEQATEFVCDEDCATPPVDGVEGNTEELMGFLESVWRVFRSDRSKLQAADSLAQPFQVLMEQLANDQLPRETVHCWQRVQQLLVIQDFKRARLQLKDLQESQESARLSDCISILSSLAEYWMTDIQS